MARPLFWRDGPEGRAAGWRVWVLIWLAPGLFLAAAGGMTGVEAVRVAAMASTEGEVVRVYERLGDTPFDRGVALYSPVFRYVWSDGQPIEASAGLAHPDWNFEVGSRHEIQYFPRQKADVRLPGRHNWSVAATVAIMGLILAVPALWAHRRTLRWLAGTRPKTPGMPRVPRQGE